MNKFLRFSLMLVIISSIIIVLMIKSNSVKKNPIENLVYIQPVTDNNFSRVINPRSFTFPKDFGSHPDFQTEWWYYTGNLQDETGRRFGYQLTFFRRVITPVLENDRQSKWATNQVYLAHFTLTNVESKEHYQKEIMARESLGLAGAKVDPLFEVNVNNWNVKQIDETSFLLFAEMDDISINLLLEDQKGIVLHGENGLSKKSNTPGNASYYFSQTRLKSTGKVEIQGEHFDVFGNSWMDHEFGSSALGRNQIGWDWFSLQFNTNQELMLFQIRQDDGKISASSSGTWIDVHRETQQLTKDDFSIEILDYWKSEDGYLYPNRWKISSSSMNFELEVTPLLPDQENRFFFRYWEGAVHVKGILMGAPVEGYGYVELTGYAQSMQGVF